MTTHDVLSWLIPPFAGGLIGFVTNIVAIRMLFRPLEAKYVGKIRVPFTPGILPRRRKELSRAIGGMVERELITAEIIKARLAEADIEKRLCAALSSFFDTMPYGEAGHNAVAEKIYPAVTARIVAFVRQPEIRQKLEAQGRVFVHKAIDKLPAMQRLAIQLGGFDESIIIKMPEIIDELINRIDAALDDDEMRDKIIACLHGELTETDDGNDDEKARPLAAALSGTIIEWASAHAGDFLSFIDIKRLVVNRIDALPMEKVERIVLDVMSNQFKWIDIFGGILGFLIGIFQAVFARTF